MNFFEEMLVLSRRSIDDAIGLRAFAFDGGPINARIKNRPDDFVVEETLRDGTQATVEARSVGDLHTNGRYAIYLLIKENRETVEAISDVARSLGLRGRQVAYLGLKDKRALTAQFLCIDVKGLKAVPSEARIEGATIHLQGFASEPLTKGNLAGNHFRVKLTFGPNGFSEEEHAAIARGTSFIASIGMPNYVGYQRFGSLRPVNHIVGYYLIKGDFAGAIRALLCFPSPFDNEDLVEAKLIAARTGDLAGLSKAVPSFGNIEVKLLRDLSLGRSPERALRGLPATVLRLFTEALSAYAYNEALSSCLRSGSWLDVEEGDLLVPTDDYGLQSDAVAVCTKTNQGALQQLVSEKRAACCIPLLGYMMKYPRGKKSQVVDDILRGMDVRAEEFFIERLPQANFPGQLRPIRVRPKNVHIETGDGFMRLSFFLPRGSFATILLRELIRPVTPLSQGF